jgi:broad specificity phosphatase PhoE
MTPGVYLVRHGLPVVVDGVRASPWELDPAAADRVVELLPRLPEQAAWFSSPEPKPLATARLLYEGDVVVVDDLREQLRVSTVWINDFAGAVRRAFAEPDVPAVEGWEPLGRCRARLLPAVRRILDVHTGEDVVLVGHGTAWTLVAAELTGRLPDLETWAALDLPDVLVIDR